MKYGMSEKIGNIGFNEGEYSRKYRHFYYLK
jgi:hypothetical protein